MSGSARLGGGHGGRLQGENRVLWAMLVEGPGNGGISKGTSSKKGKKGGKKKEKEKEEEKKEGKSGGYIVVSICSHPPAARNQPSWVLIR